MNATYWNSRIPSEDAFGDLIEDEFIDGKTRLGPWAIMTPSTHKIEGIGLGTGKGQRYQVQEDERWLKVEG